MGKVRIKRKVGRPKNQGSIIIEGDYAGLTSDDKRHVRKRFKVKRKKVGEKILLELTPFDKLNERRHKLIDELSEKLAKEVNSKSLMEDILDDVNIDNLEKLSDALNRKAKVKHREGCSYLEIKDPRRKEAFTLPIRK